MTFEDFKSCNLEQLKAFIHCKLFEPDMVAYLEIEPVDDATLASSTAFDNNSSGDTVFSKVLVKEITDNETWVEVEAVKSEIH